MKKAMRITGIVTITLFAILEELIGVLAVILYTICYEDQPNDQMIGIIMSAIIMMPGMIWIFINATKIKDKRNNSIEEAE